MTLTGTTANAAMSKQRKRCVSNVTTLVSDLLTEQPSKQPAMRHLRSFTNDTGQTWTLTTAHIAVLLDA